MGVLADQVVNIMIQIFYKQLGPEDAFNIWWTKIFIENIGKFKFIHKIIKSILYLGLRLLFNIYVYVNATRRIPEFAGYRAKYYPGQMAPRQQLIVPRRLELTPSNISEQQKKPRMIYVLSNPSPLE